MDELTGPEKGDEVIFHAIDEVSFSDEGEKIDELLEFESPEETDLPDPIPIEKECEAFSRILVLIDHVAPIEKPVLADLKGKRVELLEVSVEIGFNPVKEFRKNGMIRLVEAISLENLKKALGQSPNALQGILILSFLKCLVLINPFFHPVYLLSPFARSLLLHDVPGGCRQGRPQSSIS